MLTIIKRGINQSPKLFKFSNGRNIRNIKMDKQKTSFKKQNSQNKFSNESI